MLPIFDGEPAGQAIQIRLRILVVEDELLIRLMVAEELRDAGYEVIEACDSDEALAILGRPVRVDLMLTDVRMPGPVDGLGLLAHAQAERPALPVILMSGHLEAGEALAVGATEFLAKPFGLDLVPAAVRAALGRTR